MTMLQLNHITGGYHGREIVKDISFSLNEGEFFGILGPNGSGKTTLIKMISGLIELQSGSIRIDGKLISDFTKKQLAKKIAVLPQLSQQFFPYTVKEMVSLGRYAHQRGLFQTWTAKDEEIVQKVMRQTKISGFQNNTVMEHSGGEQQRIFLAQALAQQPEIILLDEPTNHLDIAYQKELLDLLSKSAKEEGLIVIAILHDVNLASLYCDRLLLMDKGKAKIIASPDEVLSEERIHQVYETEVIKLPHPEIAKPQLHLLLENEAEDTEVVINENLLTIEPGQMMIQSPIPLKTISSGLAGAGTGWYKSFVMRSVGECHAEYEKDMREYLIDKGLEPSQTIGIMTPACLERASFGMYEGEGFSVFAIAAARMERDAERSAAHSIYPGTVNIWLFINGRLTDEMFIQSIVTATEAKMLAFQESHVFDGRLKMINDGISSDQIVIAASQQGEKADPTALRMLIRKAVYEEVKTAMINDFKSR